MSPSHNHILLERIEINVPDNGGCTKQVGYATALMADNIYISLLHILGMRELVHISIQVGYLYLVLGRHSIPDV